MAWTDPSNNDSAELPPASTAEHVIVDRPNPERDGLDLFGKRWNAFSVDLTDDDLAALASGRQIAVDVADEYVVYISREKTD